VAATVQDVYDLTPMQQGMLFHEQLAPESRLYIEQITVPFAGSVDWRAFRSAWQDTVDHHDVLRTSFHWLGISTPVQVVHAAATMSIEAVDLLGTDGRPGQRTLADVVTKERARGFDLERPPLFRAALVRVTRDEVALVVTFHHLILDGWSLQLLFRDFGIAYRQRARGQVSRLPAAGRYRDYLLWLQAQDLGAAERYWRDVLAGVGRPPSLWSESVTSSESFGEHEVLLSPAATAAAEAAAARSRVTLSSVAQAAWALVLAASTSTDDVTFGITVSGRPGELDDVEGMVGLFINTIPLRIAVDADATVADWLRDVQRRVIEGRQFEYSPLADVQRWSGLPTGTPLFESIVAFENYPVAVTGAHGSAAPARFEERTNYPLSVIVVPGERLRLRLLFDRCHVTQATAERLAERFGTILHELGGDPSRPLGTLATMSRSDLEVVAGWDAPPTPLPATTVHVGFEEWAARRPDAVAVEFGDRVWTYRALDRAADTLAKRLEADGVGPGGRVGVLAERSPEFVIALLATLKVGAAYVPLDPASPPARLGAIVADTGAQAILAAPGFDALVAEFGVPALALTTSTPSDASEEPRRRAALVGEDDAAYVMYTSGSTGQPKGIVVPHRAINRLVLATDYLQLGPADRVAHLSNCSFDAATFEIWGPLLNGARLVGVDTGTALRADRLARFLRERAITVAFMTTALVNRVAAEQPAAFGSLDVLLFGGEAVVPKWIRRILDAAPPRRLLHVYGPTETTTYATWHEVGHVPPDATTIPIGRAIANTSVRVLDPQQRPVPVGAIGELYIGGVGVAHGYLGRPAATAERFVPDPSGGGGRMYQTGDRVRVTPAGIEFVGRVDDQVKLRGFRIEPGEIDGVIMSHHDVAACATVVRTTEDGDRQLVAYVATNGGATSAHELDELVRRELPAYMRPWSITLLDALPLNANGKIDRRALPVPSQPLAGHGTGGPRPRTPTERRLAEIWHEVLGVDSVTSDADFFDLGGHSLRAMQLLSRVQSDFGVELELREVFEHPTIAGLAPLVDGGGRTATDDRIVPQRREARRRDAPGGDGG
jgi:amino acid adenylation domain-containing protein